MSEYNPTTKHFEPTKEELPKVVLHLVHPLTIRPTDVEAFIFEGRIDGADIPDGYEKLSIRHSDTNFCEPQTLEHNVLVNHYADVLVKKGSVNITAPDYMCINDIEEA